MNESKSLRDLFLRITTMLNHNLITSQLIFLSEFYDIYFGTEFAWNYAGSTFPINSPVSYRSHEVLGQWFSRHQHLSSFLNGLGSNPYFTGI